MRSRIIALILIFTHIGYYLPAQEAVVDLARGMARLERYLDRAAQERSEKGWEELAAAGLEAALLEWESANIYMKESEPEQWAAKRAEAQWIYGLEKEAAYIEWAGHRVYAEAARGAGSALAAELKQAAAEWTYTREDGSVTRTIDMKEAGSARAAWELVAGAIIERYVEEWEGKHHAAYGELRARYEGSGLSEGELAKIYGEVSGTQRAAVYSEYARVAAAEGNALLRILLYDSQSMKKAAAGEAAGAIARRLAEEAKAASEQGIAKLFGELEEQISAAEQEGIQITSEEWLVSFRGALEAGLAKWDEAEYAFLAARAEWERDAEGAYWEGEAAWVEAYGKLEEAREEWQRELQGKLEAGRQEWGERYADLGEELRTALEEFAAVLEEKKENKRKLIEAQIGIYERSRELLEMAYQGIVYWYAQWGNDYQWYEKEYEKKYRELFGSQGPPGYESGYISRMLEQADMRALAAEGAAGLAKLEEQFELWKILCIEVIKKVYRTEYAALQSELIEKEAEYSTLQAELKGLEADLEALEDGLIELEAEQERLQAELEGLESERSRLLPYEGYLTASQQERLNELEGELPSIRDEISITRDEISRINSEIFTTGYSILVLANRRDEINGKLPKLERVLGLTVEMEGGEIGAAVDEAQRATGVRVFSSVYSLFSGYSAFPVALWNSVGQVVDSGNGWLALARKYREAADLAVGSIYELCGVDITRAGGATLEGHWDGLTAEVMKAEAVLRYWESELQVARAVEEYARRYDSLMESAEETEEQLQQARDKYESELKKYEGALEALREQGIGIAEANRNYEEQGAELEKLNREVQAARKEYAAVMALILGVSTESIQAQIAETAAAMEQNGKDRSDTYGKYLEAVQAYEAARHLAGLRQEAERIAEGEENQQSIAKLKEKIGKIQGITETAEILEQYEAVLDAALGDEKQLLEELKAAHGEAAGAEQAALEAAIQAVWGSALSYYEAELRAAAAALEYLRTGTVLAEPLSGEDRMEQELRAWLKGQLAGIEQEIMLAAEGYAGLMKLKRQRDKIEALLAADSLLAAADEERNNVDLANILKGKTELGLTGQAAALAAYREALAGTALEAADVWEWILRQYGDMMLEAVNAADAAARAAVNKIIKDTKKDPTVMSITALYGYIAELREAGEGLGLAGQTALDEYIKGLLEYAAVKDVKAQANMQINRAGAEQAYREAVARYGEIAGWLNSLQDTGAYLELLGSSAFREMTVEEQELMLRYGAGRILQELGPWDMDAGFEAFAERVRAQRDAGQTWAVAYQWLVPGTQRALYEKIRGMLRFDAYTDEYDEYVEWFAWEGDESPGGAVQEAWEQAGDLLYLCGLYELYLGLAAAETDITEEEAVVLATLEIWFAGEDAMLSENLEQIKDIRGDENRGANWYQYYLAGSGHLYIYLLLGPVSYEELNEAAEYLDAEQAEFILAYHRTGHLAAEYSRLLDGEAEAWVNGQELSDMERAMLLDRLWYGIAPTGVGCLRDWDLLPLYMRTLGTVVMYDMRAMIDMLYGKLDAAREGIVAAALELQYAQYVEREQGRNYGWTEADRGFYQGVDLKQEQADALAKLHENARDRMQGSLWERLGAVASLFEDQYGGAIAADSAAQMEDTDYAEFVKQRKVQMEQGKQAAELDYQVAAWAAGSLIAGIERHFAQYEQSKKQGAALEAEQVRLHQALVAAQDKYNTYYENEYTEAVHGIQAAYVEYNIAAGALNAAHEALNRARLEVRTRQEIYDFARSVYLREQGVGEAAGYETPKEKLGRVTYAYERAKISAEVVGSLASGNPLEDKEYSAALAKYKASAEHYYLGLAAGYEAEQTLAKQREAVAKAEAAEAAALRALVISAESYPVPYVPAPEGWIEQQIGVGELNEYFTALTVEREDILRGTYTITQAEADTEQWLQRINKELENEAEYFNDLMLAAMYMNYLYGNGNIEADDIADDDGKIKSKKEKWYQGTDPEDAGNYPLGGITALEGGTFEGKYSDARLEELKAAFDRIDGDTEKRKDLAWYLLYRDTTLVAGGAGAEQSVLVKRALDGVLQFATGRRDTYRTEAINLGTAAAAATATAALLLLVPGAGGAAAVLFAAAAVALLGSLNATDMKKKYEVAIDNIIEIQEGHPSGAGQQVAGLFTEYLAKRDRTAAERALLNIMLYGSSEVPAKENGLLPDLKYGDFKKALGLLLTTKGLKDKAVGLYSEDVFKDSDAKHYGTVTEAIGAMNRHLGDLHEAARKALNTQVDNLKEAQAAAAQQYWASVSAGQEMAAKDREKLRQLAASASNTTLSVAEREQASREYDDLYKELLNADGIREQLTMLANAAWGTEPEPGTWNSYVHDREIVGHAAGLYGGQWMRYENAAEPYTMWAGMNLEEALLEAIERQNALELSVEKARLELIGEDFIRQRAAWEAQMGQIMQVAAREWSRAAGKINEGYAQWRRTFMEEYRAKTAAWEANYLEFVLEKQEWVETQYVYAATAGNAGLLAQAEADTGEVIMRALEGTQVARMSRGTEEIEAYAAELFTETKETMSLLMGTAEGLSDRARYGAQAVKQGSERETVAAKLAAAQQTQRELNEEMQKGAARLAAIQAGKLIEEATAAYLERIAAENRGMREWQKETVGKDRYRVEGKNISRLQVVDSTVWGVTQKTQTVYAYEDFVTEGPHLQVKLNEEILSGLDPVTIMDMVDQGKRELATWGEGIFGKVGADGKLKQNQVVVPASAMTFDEYKAQAEIAAAVAAKVAAVRKQTDEKEPVAVKVQTDEELKDEYEQEMKRLDRKERDGEMGRHIGYRAILKGKGFDLTKGREWNIEYEGSGEMGKILLDMQWNTIEAQHGWAEAAKPVYDQKLWGTDEFFIAPPTIRGLTDMAMSVVAAVVNVVGNLTGGWGMLASYGINLIDDLVFATADSVFTSKNNGEVWKEFGQKAATSAVTSAMTFGFNAAGTAAEAALNGTGALTNAVAQGSIRMAQTFTTTAVTSAITGAEFKLDTGLLANVLAAGVSGGVSGGLGALNRGFENEKLLGFSKLSQKNVAKLNDLAGALAGQGVQYAMGGDFTLNVLNTGLFSGGAVNVGLLELHLGRDGAGMKFGMDGANVSIDNIYGAMQGAMVWNANNKVDKYVANDENVFKENITLRALSKYGYGDAAQNNLFDELMSGAAKIETDAEGNYTAKTETGDGGRVIKMVGYQPGMSAQDQMYLALVLGHEAYRDGVTTVDNYLETRDAVQGHTQMAIRMLNDGQKFTMNEALMKDIITYTYGDQAAFNAYVDANYDSSEDFLSITSDTTKEQYDEMFKLDAELNPFIVEEQWRIMQDYFAENPNGGFYQAPGELLWQQFEDRNDIQAIDPNKAVLDMLFLVNIGNAILSTMGRVLLEGLAVKSPAQLQQIANASFASGPQGQQLFGKFSGGYFRLERGVESVRTPVQRELGVKVGGAIQKPWHLVVNGTEIPLNPFNPLWRFFPQN